MNLKSSYTELKISRQDKWFRHIFTFKILVILIIYFTQYTIINIYFSMNLFFTPIYEQFSNKD